MSDTVIAAMLTFVAVMSLGGGLIVAMRARRQPLQSRIAQLQGGAATVEHVPESDTAISDVLGRVGSAVSSGRVSQGLKRDLAMAGFHAPGAATAYIGLKVVLGLVSLLGMMLLVWQMPLILPAKVLMVLSVAGLMSFVPNIVVSARKQKRRREILSHLPDAIDLLEICVSSGMGLDMAWNLVSEAIRRVSSAFADEMALTNLEIHLGAPRMLALRHMAERTGVDELSSLVAVMVQSERFGTSVADALRAFATSMREGRTMKAEENAEKMAVKLLFPMVVLIFPAVLVVVAGPAGITWAHIMGKH